MYTCNVRMQIVFLRDWVSGDNSF